MLFLKISRSDTASGEIKHCDCLHLTFFFNYPQREFNITYLPDADLLLAVAAGFVYYVTPTGRRPRIILMFNFLFENIKN